MENEHVMQRRSKKKKKKTMETKNKQNLYTHIYKIKNTNAVCVWAIADEKEEEEAVPNVLFFFGQPMIVD